MNLVKESFCRVNFQKFWYFFIFGKFNNIPITTLETEFWPIREAFFFLKSADLVGQLLLWPIEPFVTRS